MKDKYCNLLTLFAIKYFVDFTKDCRLLILEYMNNRTDVHIHYGNYSCNILHILFMSYDFFIH